MKLLTLLGTTSYQETTYVWNGREYRTDLFPEALVTWLSPEETLIFLTNEAKQHKNWANLKTKVEQRTQLTPIDIPSGKNEDELWKIFDTLTGCLAPSDEVMFDVSHAFRSLPILALLAAAYLRTVHTSNLSRIVYGAFEAKDASNRSPVFDLTPFIVLLDWATATDHFLKTGDATGLAARGESGSAG